MFFAAQQAANRQYQELYARQEAAKKKRANDSGTSTTATTSLSNNTTKRHGNEKRNKTPKETTSMESSSLSEHSHVMCAEKHQKKRGLFHRRQKNSGPTALEEPTAIPTTITTTKAVSELRSAPSKQNSKNNNQKSVTNEKQQKAQETLASLQKTIASQEEREAEMDHKISQCTQEAKAKLVAGKKPAAIRCMKKAKLYQMEQSKIAAAIETMEAQILTIESAMNNYKVMQAMQAGSTTMKNLQSETKDNSASFADALICEIRDTMDYAAEVREILSQPVDHVILDDDELLRELQLLSADEEAGTAAAVAMEIDLPVAPMTSSLRTSKPEGDESKDSIQMPLAD